MKALLLAHSNGGGGAGRATGRLFSALDGAGVDLRMHVDFCDQPDPRVQSPHGWLATTQRRARITADEVPAVAARHPHPQLFSPGMSSALSARQIDSMGADVVNVHWTNFGFLGIAQLGAIRTPMVWTMHDMWAFTGGMNYDDEGPDARWRAGFTRANRPSDGTRWDVERWVWERKRKHWTTPWHIVTPSSWLADLVRASALMHDWPVTVIPNALDTDTFAPRLQQEARRRLGIRPDVPVIGIALGSDLSDLRKGFDLLLQALAHLDVAGAELVVVGRGEEPADWRSGMPRTHWLGYLSDDGLIDAYSAADVIVVPSRQDNLPQTATEPQACGVPVVAFRTGGLPDAIADGQTGALADPGDAASLAARITWVLEDAERRSRLGRAARERAVAHWSYPVVGARYADHYATVALG